VKTWLVLLSCFSLYADKPDIYWKITKAPYSKEYLEKIHYKEPVFETEKFNIKLEEKETVSPWHWKVFWTLQALDVYTTVKGMEYDCVYEANILLPRKPDTNDLIRHKAIVFIPTFQLFPPNSLADKDLYLSTIITASGVANNFEVLRKAKTKGCKKL
jgi:hypothetical protein